MAVDVTADSGEHALPRPQNSGDDRGVGLGAAHEEVDVGLRRLAGGLDLLPGGGAVLILAVAHGLHHVRLVELFQQGGMRALQIVAVKVDHSDSPFLWDGTESDAPPSQIIDNTSILIRFS